MQFVTATTTVLTPTTSIFRASPVVTSKKLPLSEKELLQQSPNNSFFSQYILNYPNMLSNLSSDRGNVAALRKRQLASRYSFFPFRPASPKAGVPTAGGA